MVEGVNRQGPPVAISNGLPIYLSTNTSNYSPSTEVDVKVS